VAETAGVEAAAVMGEEAMVGAPEAVTGEAAWVPAAAAMEVEVEVPGREAAKGEAAEAAARGATPPRWVVRSPLCEAGF
jgi:hypothetical protein